MARPTVSALLAAAPRLLLTMTVAGRVVRLTDGEPVTVGRARSADSDLLYLPGLLTIGSLERLMVFAAGSVDRAVSFTAVLPFDLSEAVAQGRTVYTSTAEIAQIHDGQTWEQRHVLIAGRLSRPQHGAMGEPVSMEIVERPGDDTARIVAATHAVTAETWPRLDADRPATYVGANERIDPDILGAFGPVIIGSPGNGGKLRIAGTVQSLRVPAAPALYVERTDSNVTVADHAYLVAYHPLDAASVQIINVTDAETDTCTVSRATDGLGQVASIATPSGNPFIPTADSVELYTSFDEAVGGGLPDPFGTGPLRRADHVIRWALTMSSVRWDKAEVSRLAALRAYRIEGMINDPKAAPWPWVRDYVLSLLPVAQVGGPGGLYVAPIDPDATGAQAVAHLEVGRNCWRITQRTDTPDDDVVNGVRLSFGLNVRTGMHGQWRQHKGGPLTEAETASSYVSTSLYATMSRSIFGPREVTLDTPYIYDGATAELVCERYVRMRCLPRPQVGYQLARDLGWLRPGDVVTLTDEDHRWTQQPFHVQGIDTTGAAPQAALTSWAITRYTQ